MARAEPGMLATFLGGPLGGEQRALQDFPWYLYVPLEPDWSAIWRDLEADPEPIMPKIAYYELDQRSYSYASYVLRHGLVRAHVVYYHYRGEQ